MPTGCDTGGCLRKRHDLSLAGPAHGHQPKASVACGGGQLMDTGYFPCRRERGESRTVHHLEAVVQWNHCSGIAEVPRTVAPSANRVEQRALRCPYRNLSVQPVNHVNALSVPGHGDVRNPAEWRLALRLIADSVLDCRDEVVLSVFRPVFPRVAGRQDGPAAQRKKKGRSRKTSHQPESLLIGGRRWRLPNERPLRHRTSASRPTHSRRPRCNSGRRSGASRRLRMRPGLHRSRRCSRKSPRKVPLGRCSVRRGGPSCTRPDGSSMTPLRWQRMSCTHPQCGTWPVRTPSIHLPLAARALGPSPPHPVPQRFRTLHCVYSGRRMREPRDPEREVARDS